MWGRFWERLREWYYGRWELYDYPGVIGGAHQPHWTARIAQALVRFWLANWKWITPKLVRHVRSMPKAHSNNVSDLYVQLFLSIVLAHRFFRR
jgi:hypothetical protein